MAAGIITLSITDAEGVSHQMNFLSSDGTSEGNLEPVSYIDQGVTALLASAAGQASQLAAEVAIEAATGTPGDAAWTTGNGTLVALLKRLAGSSAGSSAGPPAGQSLGYQQVAPTSAVATLTVPTGATKAYVTIEGQTARWRNDGTAPTITSGMPIYSGSPVLFAGSLSALQLIATAGTTTYNIAYY